MSTISASTTTTTAYKVTADTTGALVFQTGATPTTAVNIDTSQNLQFNSGYGSVATAYGCRAWVNFNGSTAAIRGSGNVTSITRSGAGDYLINYTTSMPDANYSINVTAGDASGVARYTGSLATSTTQGRARTQDSGGSGADQPNINVAVFR